MAYPELRGNVDSMYERVNLDPATFDQEDIVSRCVDRFVANGYKDVKSVKGDCESIRSDVLAFTGAGIPVRLITCIYKTITDITKAPVCEI